MEGYGVQMEQKWLKDFLFEILKEAICVSSTHLK
jgi:hypothetical protein